MNQQSDPDARLVSPRRETVDMSSSSPEPSANETLRQCNEALAKRVRELEEAIAGAGQSAGEPDSTVHAAASPAGISMLEKRLQRAEERLQRSAERLQQSKDALEKMRSQRDAMASRNQGVREQLAVVRSSSQETIAGLRGERAELRKRLSEETSSSVRLRVELNVLRKQEERLTNRVGALGERLQQSKDALEKMRSQRDAMASRNQGVREQLAAVRSSSQETIARLREERAGVGAEVRDLKAEASRLRAEGAALRKEQAASATSIGVLQKRLQRSEERWQQSKDALEAMRSQRDVMMTRNDSLREQLASLRKGAVEKQGQHVERLSALRDRLASVNSLWTGARRYSSLYRQGLLFDEIEKSDVDLSADTYLCLLPSTVPAAMTLNRMHGGQGRIICDSVENIEVHKHSLAPNLHPPTLDLVNLGAYGALTAVDGIMTVSNAVAETLTRFGPPVRLQPNYRRYEEPSPAGDLRERLGLDSEVTILVTTGNVVKGFDAVIDAVALLPKNVHLVALVKMSPSTYDAEMRAYIESKGLSERVHLLGFVPYDELAGVLSDADLGLITLDPDNPNHSVSLPNRVFDFTTAGLPFVVPPLAEIAAFVEEHHCGAVVPEVSAEAWAETIQQTLLNLSDFREAMWVAREKVTWESLDDGLIDFLGNPKSVTLLGFRDLSRYQRFLRVTDSLTQHGIHVKAAFFSEDPLPVKNVAAEFYHFTDRYGRGSGLQRVPSLDG